MMDNQLINPWEHLLSPTLQGVVAPPLPKAPDTPRLNWNFWGILLAVVAIAGIIFLLIRLFKKAPPAIERHPPPPKEGAKPDLQQQKPYVYRGYPIYDML